MRWSGVRLSGSMTVKMASVFLATVFAVLFVCFLWAFTVSQPRSVGVYVTIGGPLTIVSCGGPRLLVLQVLPRQKLRLNVDDIDERALPVKVRVALNNNFVPAIYIVVDPSIPAGEVIRAIDLVKGIGDLNLSTVLVTPGIEREANPCR